MPELTDLYRIDNFIDTFALGHYARVLGALDRRSGHTVAFKVLRPEHLLADGDLRWEYRAFGNEAEILAKLADSPHVVNLLDCGYVSTVGEAPATGEIASFQRDVRGFTGALTTYAERGWRPYLTLEHLPRTRNLFYLMKPQQGGTRWRLPTEEGLALALQFAQLLQLAHSHGIVYLDHKLEHIYWDGAQLRIIDFNSSQQLANANNLPQEKTKDIHNLCVGVLYPIFTGMSPQKASFRPQPGGLDVVRSRYEDVDQLDFMMEPSLSQSLRELLQAGAAQDIIDVDAFITGLQRVGAANGWDFPGEYSSAASRDARDQLRAGLRRLRAGESQLREARDLFREALIMDNISEDLEAELRRLVKGVNDMLNHRVIP